MDFRIHKFPELESTNDEASAGKYFEGDVIVCRSQTRGRGQRGNGWHSSPGDNLTFSIVAQPRFLPAPEQFLLSEAVSLAAADTLTEYGIVSSIKWPNDIYVGDRKIAGILIENDICGGNISRSIIGIGLNINETGFPDYLPNPVSMTECIGRTFDPDEVLSSYLRHFGERYGLLRDGYVDEITADYDSLIYRKDIPSRYRRPSGEQFRGTITEVKPCGVLIMETEKGTEEFLFKEVEFVI